MTSNKALLFSQIPLRISNRTIASIFLHPCDLSVYFMDYKPVMSFRNLQMIIKLLSNSLCIIASNSPKWYIQLLERQWSAPLFKKQTCSWVYLLFPIAPLLSPVLKVTLKSLNKTQLCFIIAPLEKFFSAAGMWKDFCHLFVYTASNFQVFLNLLFYMPFCFCQQGRDKALYWCSW